MRWLALLLLSLVVVTGAWWLVRETGDPGSEALPSLPAVSGGEARRGAPAGELDLLRGRDPGPTRLGREEVLDTPQVPGASPVREAVRRGDIEVLVIDAETGAPFPDAIVTFLDRRTNPDWTRSWGSAAQRLQFLRTHGGTLTADATGRLKIPETDSGALAARTPGYHGFLEWATAPNEGLRLELATEIDLRVRVLDEAGRPRSGVPVVLVRDRGGAPVPLLTRQSAGAEGVATFPRIRQLLGGEAASGRHTITFGFPCLAPPGVEIDPDALVDELVDLRMPATGRVVVRVLDETGGPLQEVANATLGASLDGDGRPIQYGATTQRIVGGRATFPFVGVGARFELRLDGSRERPSLKEVAAGPTRPGEEKEVVVSWEERHPVLVGRAVSVTGEPLVQRRGRYQLRRGEQAFVGPPITTDGSGKFRIVIDSSRGPLAGALVEASLYSARGEAPLETSISLDRTLSSGETAIGDVTFLPQPVVASGRVADASGTPLFGVHVRAEVQEPNGSWAPQRELDGTTDRDGRFAIHGRLEAPTVRVAALRQGYEEARVGPVAVGASGLELVLQPRGGR